MLLDRTSTRPRRPRGGREEARYDPSQPEIKIPGKVPKGGSHLCAPICGRRCRPQPVDTAISRGGFRCVVRPAGASR